MAVAKANAARMAVATAVSWVANMSDMEEGYGAVPAPAAYIAGAGYGGVMGSLIRDVVLGIKTKVVTRTYLVVRCAECLQEFDVDVRAEWSPWTVRCRRYGCGRVCRLDEAVRAPEVLPDCVVPLRPLSGWGCFRPELAVMVDDVEREAWARM